MGNYLRLRNLFFGTMASEFLGDCIVICCVVLFLALLR